MKIFHSPHSLETFQIRMRMGMEIRFRFLHESLAFPILVLGLATSAGKNLGLNTAISNINETSMHAVEETHALLTDL